MFMKIVIITVALVFHGSLASLNKEEKQDLLDAHNYLRGKLARNGDAGQPSASNMIALHWDDEAASRAQHWADECISGHDTYDDRKYGAYKLVGQNWAGSTGYSLNSNVKAWYDEIQGYRFSDQACSAPPCGHYTQVVWAKSAKVGCGVANCKKRGGYEINLVCDYATAGNYNNEHPYTTGTACSNCPQPYPFCLNGLCASAADCKSNDCKCPIKSCENGGQVDSGSCKCKCKDGYYGSKCQSKCSNSIEMCNYINPKTDCVYSNIIEGCVKTCGLCQEEHLIPSKNSQGIDVNVPSKYFK